ncbi:MAG: hypothetical protein KGH63_00805, partial [Candidatus Micrarchaeota archaeon]|nr:hypothetical protein [Candidatus Micrarchaeota archaeon]
MSPEFHNGTNRINNGHANGASSASRILGAARPAAIHLPLAEAVPRRKAMQLEKVQFQHFHDLKSPIMAIKGFAEMLLPLAPAQKLVDAAQAYIRDFEVLVRLNTPENLGKLGQHIDTITANALELKQEASQNSQARRVIEQNPKDYANMTPQAAGEELAENA